MKAGLAAALIACREAAALGLAGDVVVAAVADEEHASLGVQEVLGGRARRRRDRDRADRDWRSSSRTRASCGRRSRCTAGPPTARARTSGVDAIVKTGPILTAARRARRGARRARHPLLGAAVGPRVGDRGRRGALELPGRAACSRSSGGRCPARPRRRRGGARRAARRVPRGGPGLRACRRRCSCASRSRSPRTRRSSRLVGDAVAATLGRRLRSRARATGPTRRSSRAAGIPTVLFGPGGEGAHAPEEWVSLSDTEAVARVLVDVAEARLRMRALVNAGVRPGGGAAAVADALGFHASLPGYPPTPVRDLRASRRARPRRRRAEGRVRPARAAGVQGARRVVGGRAARSQPRPEVHTLVAASAGNHGRAVAHVAALRGLRCRIFLPARSAAGARREAIAGEGAEVVVVDGDYEDAVARASAARARRTGVAEIADVGTSDAAALGDRRLRDAVRRARRAGHVRRRSRPDRRRLARAPRPRGSPRAGRSHADRRRARHRRVPDRVARRRARRRASRRRARRWPASTARRSPPRPGRRCATASTARSPCPTTRSQPPCASSPAAGLAIGESGAAPLAASRALATEERVRRRCATVAGLGRGRRVAARRDRGADGCACSTYRSSWSSPRVRPTRPGSARIARSVPATYGAGRRAGVVAEREPFAFGCEHDLGRDDEAGQPQRVDLRSRDRRAARLTCAEHLVERYAERRAAHGRRAAPRAPGPFRSARPAFPALA